MDAGRQGVQGTHETLKEPLVGEVGCVKGQRWTGCRQKQTPGDTGQDFAPKSC